MHARTRILLGSLFLSTSAFACTDTGLVGMDGDAGRDAPPGSRRESCGNGLDDDRNGRIDDGCPCGPGEVQSCFSGDYPSSGVGICMGGMQTCTLVSGSEWGDWGNEDCLGETVPSAAEACDGRDDDCDGAIDEGCPCEEGATRPCGEEFVTAPCSAGTQACSGGRYTACEGAVGPSAEVCGDSVDNDCNGVADDASLCLCIPVPEVCDNRVDDDCDGVTDEPSCRAMPDAGMSVPDAGTDASIPPPMCGEPQGPQCLSPMGGTIDLGLLGPPMSIDSGSAGSHAGEMTLVGSGYFARVDPTGRITTRPFFLRESVQDEQVQLLDTGTEYVMVWTPDDDQARLQRVSYVGDLLGSPVLLGTGDYTTAARASLTGDTVTVVFSEYSYPAGMGPFVLPAIEPPLVQRFDLSLTPRGPATPLDLSVVPTDSEITQAVGMIASDPSHLVVNFIRRYTAPTGESMAWNRPILGAVEGAAVRTTFDPVWRDFVANRYVSGVPMAASCGRVLAWWTPPTGRVEPFPAGGSRDVTASRRVVLDARGAVVAPITEPIGERFGSNPATVHSLGANGFAVVEQSDASVFESPSSGEYGVLARVALDGTLLGTTPLRYDGWGDVAPPISAVVDGCVFIVRKVRRVGDPSDDRHSVLTRYCPSEC